jgi:hypothetical protein
MMAILPFPLAVSPISIAIASVRVSGSGSRLVGSPHSSCLYIASPPFALPLTNVLVPSTYAISVYSSRVGCVSASHHVSERWYRSGLCPPAVASLMWLADPCMALTFLYSFVTVCLLWTASGPCSCSLSSSLFSVFSLALSPFPVSFLSDRSRSRSGDSSRSLSAGSIMMSPSQSGSFVAFLFLETP